MSFIKLTKEEIKDDKKHPKGSLNAYLKIVGFKYVKTVKPSK